MQTEREREIEREEPWRFDESFNEASANFRLPVQPDGARALNIRSWRPATSELSTKRKIAFSYSQLTRVELTQWLGLNAVNGVIAPGR